MKNDLSELWERIKDGDQRAWGTLVSEYASLVYAVARRVGLERPDAEDCAQWTWLCLYRQRHQIRDPLAIPAWLIRTTHRRAVQNTGVSSDLLGVATGHAPFRFIAVGKGGVILTSE